MLEGMSQIHVTWTTPTSGALIREDGSSYAFEISNSG